MDLDRPRSKVEATMNKVFANDSMVLMKHPNVGHSKLYREQYIPCPNLRNQDSIMSIKRQVLCFTLQK